MWNSCSPISSDTLKKFEVAFDFTINAPLRDFLLAHNDSKTRQCSLITNVKERRLASILDFTPGGNAWEINRRMRKQLGKKFLVIGTDRCDNFLCVHRELRQQTLVIWNHITDTVEESVADIPMVLMVWQSSNPNTERSAESHV